MNFAGALKALDRRQESRIELGLRRVTRHLSLLGNPHRDFPAIHVAGTNGKGSVCAMLERVLRSAGLRTGLYTSPHLDDVRERIRIDGRPIPRRTFARHMSRALEAEGSERLTYFELLTSAAFQCFSADRVDVAILETGLGGRLDATNVLPHPLACVITSIGIDHTAFLGNTLKKIAEEKAGIIKAGTPVICPALADEAMAVVRRRARSLGSPLHVVRAWRSLATNSRTRRIVGPRGIRYELSLLGGRQPQNAALAYAALRQAAGSARIKNLDKAFSDGLKRVACPGRFDVIRCGRRVAIVDGAHNPEAIRSLRRSLAGIGRQPTRFIIGVLKDKDASAMLRALGPGLTDVVAVTPPSGRALPAARLVPLIRSASPGAAVTESSTVSRALKDWLADPKAPSRAVVCGSFYLVGPALKALGRDLRTSGS